jgi:hypothetical protein
LPGAKIHTVSWLTRYSMDVSSIPWRNSRHALPHMCSKGEPVIWRSLQRSRAALAISDLAAVIFSAHCKGIRRLPAPHLRNRHQVLRRCGIDQMVMAPTGVRSHRNGLAPFTPCRSPGALRKFPNRELTPPVKSCRLRSRRALELARLTRPRARPPRPVWSMRRPNPA